jgi:superfamily II DNA or RNA helicase
VNNFDPCQSNQPVQQISNPARRGITTGRCRESGTRTFAQVEFWSQERDYIACDDLKPLTVAPTGIQELLGLLEFGKKGDLARILTFHKISSNLSNVFYAMQASRTDFYAYQFKPVYKFVESLRGRILVTDEVGLGKTIEAGLIWLEARARSDARRLLVVCPSMLREKWKQELRFRFDVKAELYDSRGMIRLLDDFKRETDNFQCAAICSLQTIRQDTVQNALRDLEETPCRFDLVVVDEAHYMRNVKTKSHKAGKLLSELTESLVLLTATPINIKNEDLFRLLNIIDEDEFDNRSVFEGRLEANAPVVLAQNALRQAPPAIDSAKGQVAALSDSIWFRDNPLVELAASKLRNLDVNDHSKVVEVGRLLEDINLLAATVSRTRKREVQEWRVVRHSAVLRAEFNDREMAFYKAVTEAVRERLIRSQEGNVTAFGLMMPQLQMASCIPAMVEHYRQNPIGGTTIDEELLEEFGLSIDEDAEEGANAQSSALSLQSLINTWEPTTPDTKFAALASGLSHHFKGDPDAKVVIFSYFKKTLSYLERRLREAGYCSVLIHGGVPMEERLELISRFKNDSATQVLLSSEVGAEGIDLQFSRFLVNYDLPWNPMKVEQRIGRLDRLGQKAEKITIINFAIRDTIEERILERLYLRIGIFRHSIGDLEPILGSEVQELTLDLLSHHLSPEQEAQRITQTQLAVEARRQNEIELVEQSTLFFGSSDYILEQIGQARELGRWITPEDLRGFVQDFFDNAYKGTRINWNAPEKGLVTISLSNSARNEFAHFCRMQTPALSTRLTHPGSNDVILAVESEASQEHTTSEVLSHFHPLVSWIVDCHRKNEEPFFPTSAVEVRTTSLPKGDYLCAIEFWSFFGIRKEVQIAYSMASLDGGNPISTSSGERLIREILSTGKTWEFANRVVDPVRVVAAWDVCIDRLSLDRENGFKTFQQKTVAAAQRRKAHLEGYGRRKEETLLKAISTSEQRGLPESRTRAFRTQLANHRAAIDSRLRLIEQESKPRDEFKEVAAVLCRIVN